MLIKKNLILDTLHLVNVSHKDKKVY